MFASALGPFISCIMFLAMGDKWHMWALQRVVLAGLVLSIPASLSCFFYTDLTDDEYGS